MFALRDAYPRYVDEVLRSEQGRRDVPAPKQLDTLEPWSVPGPGPGPEGSGGGVEVINEQCLAQQAYKVEWLVLDGAEGKAELVHQYRAMMHIDMLPPFQGQGWGRKMIERFVESVREGVRTTKGADGTPLYDHGRGIQIGVAAENKKVVPFYERVGFRVYPGGEKEGGNVWMVRDL